MPNGRDHAGPAVAALRVSRDQGAPTLDDGDTLRAFVARLAEGVYITTEAGEILDCNAALLRILGAASIEELQQHHAADLYCDPRRRREQQRLLRRDGCLRDFEIRIRRLDGSERTVLDTVFLRHDTDGNDLYFGILIDITERKELEQRYRDLSVRDPLTGCHNRRYLERVREELERPTAVWGCLLLDIDDFKSLNDLHGHEEGDRVLQRLVHFIRRHARAEDVLVRLGGDEFALIVPSGTRRDVDRIAERLLQAADEESPAPFTVGTASRRAGDTLEQLLSRADRAMYAAKSRAQPRPAPRIVASSSA